MKQKPAPFFSHQYFNSDDFHSFRKTKKKKKNHSQQNSAIRAGVGCGILGRGLGSVAAPVRCGQQRRQAMEMASGYGEKKLLCCRAQRQEKPGGIALQ